MRYLTSKELQYINQHAVESVGGTNYGIQSMSSFEIIINQPQQVIFDKELYPTIWLKAAFMFQKITKKHVFVDGNKRTAIQAALYFLYINGYKPKNNQVINGDGENLVMMVTNSPDSEVIMVKIADWFKEIMEPIN
jgi:death on curing protein